jgi:hypothetical protein
VATVTKQVDPASGLFGREVIFTSVGSEFVQGDILNVEGSLGFPATKLSITTAGDASIVLRINAVNRRYPLYSYAKNLNIPNPDLQAGVEWVNTSAPALTIGFGVTADYSDLVIGNIQVVTLVAGAGTGVQIAVR